MTMVKEGLVEVVTPVVLYIEDDVAHRTIQRYQHALIINIEIF